MDRPVRRELLELALSAATAAPSNRNGQPWEVVVVSGQRRDALAKRLQAEFDSGVEQNLDYRNRPGHHDDGIEARALNAITGVLLAKGYPTDRAGRRAHLRDNLGFYGAPTEMIFHLSADAPPGQFLEMGLFLQNVMLALVACGLGCCPQGSVAGYADAIRDELGLGADRLIVCGLAVGYPDESSAVNHFHPGRAELSEFVQWHDEVRTEPSTTE